ncbi:hypothetical protein LCGC14_3054830 [marine sediment metagenome]|uniref:Histidine kinase N-terminal 7TM region domain-containing protein n=1 Tax=marine sediment metagenome TaxID=412755 RepID=A0A0F8ZBJ0_9ZZZZ
MSYSPFQPRVFPIFIYYIFISIFGILVTIKMFLKWKERRVRPPLYLALVFTFLTMSIINLLIGLLEAIITEEFREIYRLSLPLAYVLVIVADIFLFIFASHMTNKGHKAFIPVILIGIILTIILFLPWNWWGFPSEDYAGEVNIRLFSTLSFVLYSNLIYIYIAFICYKIKKNVDDKIMYIGLKLLFYSMISLILLFVMLISDTIMITLGDEGYSVFIYIAWIFGIIFIILSYFSLIMPDWLVKRIKKKYKI